MGWQLFSYWQLELFGSLRRNWVKPCLLGLLSFPNAWALVSHVKVLFGAKSLATIDAVGYKLVRSIQAPK